MPVSKFQSLIGFKINWNAKNLMPISQSNWFQSLIGFKINWNKYVQWQVSRGAYVSIPNRV
ncbi:unknown protein [Microcystis aeruginosa NIES-843]|uniref:Uncharacterized protein n=1 Tax=Microcystis aeruginosa (strain NIES-843 / IAM M-2473) TaxID=449447 RepID=B0JKY6_MICAN|nr:unknown protein [Microcystis aeruginosa NIES-843]